jgi:thiol-disulfide isomerase/thioredoxin
MKKSAPDGNEACPLLASGADLEKLIRETDKLFVLFYASWCPFSQMFLPTFIDHAAKGEPCYRRILVDEEDTLVEKYKIEVYPTVLFFRNGRVEKRLDGAYQVGLSKGKLEDFVGLCSPR